MEPGEYCAAQREGQKQRSSRLGCERPGISSGQRWLESVTRRESSAAQGQPLGGQQRWRARARLGEARRLEGHARGHAATCPVGKPRGSRLGLPGGFSLYCAPASAPKGRYRALPAVRAALRSPVQAGVHVVVGTPGRVYDMLRRRALRADNIKVRRQYLKIP